jgi:hypothetical protein
MDAPATQMPPGRAVDETVGRRGADRDPGGGDACPHEGRPHIPGASSGRRRPVTAAGMTRRGMHCRWGSPSTAPSAARWPVMAAGRHPIGRRPTHRPASWRVAGSGGPIARLARQGQRRVTGGRTARNDIGGTTPSSAIAPGAVTVKVGPARVETHPPPTTPGPGGARQARHPRAGRAVTAHGAARCARPADPAAPRMISVVERGAGRARGWFPDADHGRGSHGPRQVSEPTPGPATRILRSPSWNA